MGTFTAPAADHTYDVGIVHLNPDGSSSVQVIIRNLAGAPIDLFILTIALNGPVMTETGVQVAAQLPSNARTAQTAYLSALNAAVDAAAAAGKFVR